MRLQFPNIEKPATGATVNHSHPLSQGLLSCWLFNEGAGTKVRDIARGVNNGSFVNAPIWSSRGKRGGKSILFAVASAQYINCGVNASVVMTPASKFSFSAWVRSTTSGTNLSVCGKYDSSGAIGYFFNCINSAGGGNVYMQVQSAAGTYIYRIGTKAVSDGVWHHIVGTYAGTSAATGLRLYVDGVEDTYSDTQTVGTLGSLATTSNFTIGQRGDVGAQPLPYDGNIDNVRMYNRVLTPTEVKRLYGEPYAGIRQKGRRTPVQVSDTIRFDAASNSGYQAASSSYSWAHVCTGSDRYLVVGISMLSLAQTVTALTYNGVAMTKIGVKNSVSGACRVELWGLIAPATGSNTIAVTLSGAIASAGVASSYTGVHQTSPTEGFNSNQATNVGAADATVSVTTVADYDWVTDIIATDDTAINVGSGQTSRNNVTGAGGSGADSDEGPKTPAGAVTMSWTDVGALATWSIGAVALRPTSATTLSSGGRVYAFIM